MRTWIGVAGALLLSAVFAAVLLIPSLDATWVTLVSNGGQLLAAALASAGCARAARHWARAGEAGRTRAWIWLAVGTGSWAAGQVVWSYYEVIAEREVPFPSLADVGFLGFPLAAAVGLVTLLGIQSHELVARGRDLLDGAIIAGSLVVLSWVTSLGSVITGGADSVTNFGLSVAYPVGDLVLGTLVLLALARGQAAERCTLLVLAGGLGGLAVSDSAYLYLVAQGSYTSADVLSSGWVLGFLLVGVAGLTVGRSTTERRAHLPVGSASTGLPALRLVLPYLPLLAAGGVLAVTLLLHPHAPTVDLLLGILLVCMVLGRQFLAMVDNQRLVRQLADVRDQLQHQTLHDPLTGLANRVLFADRLDHALARRDADVSVLYCDIDDFKNVNDQLGHEAGDEVLRTVAARLRECLRSGDTAARLGGDEFALLLEHGDDPVEVAERVVTAVGRPIEVHGRTMPTSMSVGVSRHRGGDVPLMDLDGRTTAGRLAAGTLLTGVGPESTAAELLRCADTAMYAAKGAGKGRAVMSEEHPRVDGHLRRLEPQRSAG